MRKLTTQEFIRKSQNIHGLRYDYSNVDYVDAGTKVKIICPVHGGFLQTPYNHMRGYGCPICNRVDGRKLGADEFVKRSREVHGVKYDYSKVEYVNTKTPVKIVCPEHGVFLQKPEKHMIGHGCPRCCKNYHDTTESFIEKARLVHGNFYDYSKVQYVDQHTKVCIIDPDYGEFWQQPNSHLNGRGSLVRRYHKMSQPEERVNEFLVAKFGKEAVFRQYRSEAYPFACDFYVSTLDLYIELNLFWSHGFHWFDPDNPDDVARLLKLQSHAEEGKSYRSAIDVWTRSDLLKRETAISGNLNYLVFWDNDLSDFMKWYDAFDEHPVLKQF